MLRNTMSVRSLRKLMNSGKNTRSVSLQAKLTAIAVNLKRIAKMVSSSDSKNTSKKQFINTKYLYKIISERGMTTDQEKAA